MRAYIKSPPETAVVSDTPDRCPLLAYSSYSRLFFIWKIKKIIQLD